MTKIGIYVPTVSSKAEGQINPKLAKAIFDEMKEHTFSPSPYDVFFDFVDNFHPVYNARNEICKRFLETDNDYLIMCDLDTVPPPDFVRTLIEIPGFKRDYITACPYAMYCEDGYFVLCCGKNPSNQEQAGYQFPTDIPNEWSEWDVIGMGCVCIPRYILEDDSIFETYSGKMKWFDDSWGTEDVGFCEKLRMHGIKIYTHPSLIAQHYRITDITRILGIQNAIYAQKGLK